MSSTSTSYYYSYCNNYCTINNVHEDDKLWKRLAHLAIMAISCQLPILLLLLDSRHCTTSSQVSEEGRCTTLGNGSVSYFLSLFALTALLIIVKFNTMPDWKEEYELWQLLRQRNHEIIKNGDNMTMIEKKKDGHNVIEDPKNSTMMSDDDDYDDDVNHGNREYMDEERRVVNCLNNVGIHSTEKRYPTIPMVIQCPVSKDEHNSRSIMMMTMMMPANNDITKSSPHLYKGNIMQIETNEQAQVKCGGEQELQQQQRMSSSPTSVIVDNGYEFHSPPLTPPACSVMVVKDEELRNNSYLQLSFSTINNDNKVIISNVDIKHVISQPNDYDDTSACNDCKVRDTTNDIIGVNRSSIELSPTRSPNQVEDGIHQQHDDPELDMYPSDSSLSELSLDSDDEHQSKQSKPQLHPHQDACIDDDNVSKTTNNAIHCNIYFSADNVEFTSDDNDDSESEMYAIIAGVRKLNRRMSGKTAPQYKRRRLRKGMDNDVSTVKSFTSHGSLFDKIIHEESAEGDVPSPPRMTISTKKKKKREDHNQHHEGEVDDCYPSLINSDEVLKFNELQSLQSPLKEIVKKNDNNPEENIHPFLDRNGDISCGSSGGDINDDVVSDSEASMSLRASQARKQRILSGQRFSLLLHDSDKDEYDDDNVYNSYNRENNADVIFRSVSNSPSSSEATGIIACESQLTDASKNIIIERCCIHINSAWQARQVRMARLRMSRGEQEKPSLTLEPEGKIFRATDNLVVACYSDENSI